MGRDRSTKLPSGRSIRTRASEMAGADEGRAGHPLPASDESRHGEVPEGAVEEKGFGDDQPELVQPAPRAANPDGEPYRYDDNGRAEDVDTDGSGSRDPAEP